MKIRTVIAGTAIVSSLLGALVAYLVLSVPNDLRADALLKNARQDLTEGNNTKARESLSKVIQQYPRTDAAAAATVALVTLGAKDRENLARAIVQLRQENETQAAAIKALQTGVTEIKNTPPKVVTVQAPPKPTPKKAPVKKAPTRRRRRR